MDERININITVSPDEYNAYLSVKPVEGALLTLQKLGPLLKSNGVVYGIKRDVLRDVVERFRKGEVVSNAMVAEGTQPFEGKHAEIEYKFEFSRTPKVDESGKVDYREMGNIISVEAGQLLAIKRKGKEPVTGVTVTGKRTEFADIQDVPLQPRANVVLETQGDLILYRATTGGALKFENNNLSVQPILVIKEDVDFDSGNVQFQGDVKVGRDVLPDFKVESEGSISIWGSAIACKLICKDGLTVRAGIVGKNKGEVICGGDVKATFMENVKIKAGGDISVKNGIIGCNVFCDGTLNVEISRSRIVGSTIRAAQSIIAYNAGSRFDTTTQLTTGISPLKEKEFFKIKEFLDGKLNDTKELEKKYGRAVLEKKEVSGFILPQKREDMERWDHLKVEIQNILKRLKQTENEMFDYQAVIRIKETLYPRVLLKIGKYKRLTEKEYYNATVRYSPEKDRLVID